jgi:hypothetical protein
MLRGRRRDWPERRSGSNELFVLLFNNVVPRVICGKGMTGSFDDTWPTLILDYGVLYI